MNLMRKLITMMGVVLALTAWAAASPQVAFGAEVQPWDCRPPMTLVLTEQGKWECQLDSRHRMELQEQQKFENEWLQRHVVYELPKIECSGGSSCVDLRKLFDDCPSCKVSTLEQESPELSLVACGTDGRCLRTLFTPEDWWLNPTVDGCPVYATCEPATPQREPIEIPDGCPPNAGCVPGVTWHSLADLPDLQKHLIDGSPAERELLERGPMVSLWAVSSGR